MGAKLGDLEGYWSPGLTLTIRGREYVVPLASAELGLWCRHMAQLTGDISSASTEDELRSVMQRVEDLPETQAAVSLAERVLGDTYAAMVSDGVEDPYIQFAGQTAYVWIVGGEGAAERFWTSGGRPESLRPVPANRGERRAQQRGQGGQKSTDAASGTRSRGSTSGTKSRAKSRKPVPAADSPGRKS